MDCHHQRANPPCSRGTGGPNRPHRRRGTSRPATAADVRTISVLGGRSGKRGRSVWRAAMNADIQPSPHRRSNPMDDVTRVPRTLTRRGALGAIAAATAAVTVAGARPADAAPAIDPIYAAIEQHRHTAKIWGSAVDAEACFPDRHMNNEQARQFEFLQQAREAARDTQTNQRPPEKPGPTFPGRDSPPVHAGGFFIGAPRDSEPVNSCAASCY